MAETIALLSIEEDLQTDDDISLVSRKSTLTGKSCQSVLVGVGLALIFVGLAVVALTYSWSANKSHKNLSSATMSSNVNVSQRQHFLLLDGSNEHSNAEQNAWSYDAPEDWPPLCHNGQRQSPINIDNTAAVKIDLPPLKFHGYGTTGEISVKNNGHSVEGFGFQNWSIGGSERPYISGGGLSGKYDLVQFHFHWGLDQNGSEHTINDRHYPLEVHFVHQKSNITKDQAFTMSDGMAVVAVFFNEDASNGQPLSQLEPAFKATDSFGATVTISGVVLQNMLPNEPTFYRYNGSLTTPDCNEVVVWMILTSPMTVTNQQLEELRQHLSASANKN